MAQCRALVPSSRTGLRSTNWDVREIGLRSATAQCSSAFVQRWSGVWWCVEGREMWGRRPLGQCGCSVADGPGSSPSGRQLMCRMATLLRGVIAAGGVDAADPCMTLVPVISPAVFSSFWRSTPSAETRLRPDWDDWQFYCSITCYSHINTHIVGSKMARTNGLKMESRIGQRCQGLWFYCFLFYFNCIVSA